MSFSVNPMNQQLICPMAAYVFYTWVLAIYNFLTRFHSLKSKQVSMKYYRALQGEAPERVVTVGRHYDNQFQLPMLFFSTGAVFLATGAVTQLTVTLAWVFVATRLAHSFIHLGKNDVRLRVSAFASGWLCIVAMWIQLCWPQHFQS